MELELRESDGDVLRFLLSGVTPAFANSIRRTIVQGLPVMAINEAEVSRNDSVVSDEVLAHRLGQMPLSTPDGYLLPSECDCRGGRCENCSVTFSLSVEGPGVVRADDLESSDPDVRPVHDDAPIMRLGEGQRLEFEAIARLGFGEEHPNWQPAIASYKYLPIINIDQEARDDWEKCVEICPEDILEEEDGELIVTDVEKCTMCEACAEECPEAIEIDGDPSKYIFRIETTGSIPPEEMVIQAINILKEKCEDFSEQVEKF